jgi:hypothetical protein
MGRITNISSLKIRDDTTIDGNTTINGYLSVSELHVNGETVSSRATSVGILPNLTVSGDVTIGYSNSGFISYPEIPWNQNYTHGSWEGYTATASHSIYYPEYAFDNNSITRWSYGGYYGYGGNGSYIANITVTTYNDNGVKTIKGEWLQIGLPKEILLTKYSISGRIGLPERCPWIFKVVGSNNNSTWQLVDSRSTTWSNSFPQTFLVTPGTSYSYYRLIVTNVGPQGSGSGYSDSVEITEWKLFESGNTIVESVTVKDNVLNSNILTSTSLITDNITSNINIMSNLTVNNTLSILSESSVLYPQVFSTNNNNWSGYIVTAITDSNDAYKVFDNNPTTYWTTSFNTDNISQGYYTGIIQTFDGISNYYRGIWLDIQLPTSISLYSYSLLGRNDNDIGQMPAGWVLLGSNDNRQTWNVIDTRQNQVNWILNEPTTFISNNIKYYNIYRLVINQTMDSPRVGIVGWNLYTKPSAITINGANVSANQLNINSNTNVNGILSVSGNVNTGNINVIGNILVNGQPITTGTSSTANLTITGNVNAGNVNATLLSGTLATPAQPNITSIGTLNTLTVSGNINSGNINATLLTGYLRTSTQPNITSIGTLNTLTVSGNVNAGNVNATLLSGTLATPAQPNIISVGILTNLNVSGNLIVGSPISYPLVYASGSNSWNGYIASSSGASPAEYNAFDNNATTFWESSGNYNPSGGIYVGPRTTTYDGSSTITGEWLQLQLPNPISLYSYSILGRIGQSGRSPNTFNILGSNNGSTWTLVDSQSNVTGWGDGIIKTFTPNNVSYYIYYRIVINKNGGGTNIDIATWNLFYNPPPITMLNGNVTATLGTFNNVATGNLTILNGVNDGGQRMISALDNNMAIGSTKYIALGQSNSTVNQAEITFNYYGSGNVSNNLGLGLYGSPIMYLSGSTFVGLGARSNEGFANANKFLISGATANLTDGMGILPYGDTYNLINFYNQSRVVKGSIGSPDSSSVTFNTSSDNRLKENIIPMTSMIGKIKQLEPKHFEWKNDSKKEDGFIAQQVHKVFPNFIGPVSTYCNVCNLDRNDIYNGNLCTCCDWENPTYKDSNQIFVHSLDYGKFTPYLTKALQETIQMVEDQQKQIDELKELVNSLKGNIV